MHACGAAASSAFHATVPASSPVPTPHPVLRVGLRLTSWHGKVLALVYVFNRIPPPGGMSGSLPPSPPGSDDEASDD
eukprot:4810466-Pleurochrysis_carterae.AAC.1